MSKVLVDRELLERCVDRWACCAIVETPGAEQAWLELRAVVKAAQSTEAEGVELRRYTPISQGDHLPAMNSCDQGGWVRHSDHLAALSAVTVEVEALRKDAERYRWIRGYGLPDVAIIETDSYYDTITFAKGCRLDTAIDNAMQKS